MTFRRGFLALAALLGLSACASAPGPAAPVGPAAEAGAAAFEPGQYRLGAGDRLRMIVYEQEALSGEFTVDGTGTVAFPLIGNVKAADNTVRELEGAVAAKLRDGYLSDPRVSIEVLNHRPFYILGEVARPGEYPYTVGLTVLNAVATAGGFSYRADTKRVRIKRATDPLERQVPLDPGTPVLPGDTIRIPQRMF